MDRLNAKSRTERRVDVTNLGRVLQMPASAGPALEGTSETREYNAAEIHTLGDERTAALRSAWFVVLGNLNFPNRRIRTRTSGGVGGE